MSIWMVLNFLNQFSNACALRMLHNRMWQSRNSEVTRSVLIARDLIRHALQRVAPFYHEFFISNVEVCAFMRGTCLGNSWLVICVTADNGCHRSIMFNSFFMKRTCFDLLGMGRFSSTLRGPWVAPVAPFYHDLGLELVGSIGNF